MPHHKSFHSFYKEAFIETKGFPFPFIMEQNFSQKWRKSKTILKKCLQHKKPPSYPVANKTLRMWIANKRKNLAFVAIEITIKETILFLN